MTGSGGETTLYDTTGVATGPLVADFREQGIIILFGEEAPEELWDLAVRHRPRTAAAGPVAGDVVEIDGTRLPVLAVGSVVEENLLQLGHLDLKADGRREPAMPGDLCGPAPALPRPREGSVIRLVRPEPAS